MKKKFNSGYGNFDKNGDYWRCLDDNHVLARCLLSDAVIAFAVYDKRTDELVYRKGIIPVEFKLRDSSIDKVVAWLERQSLTKLTLTRNVTVV